MAKLKKFPKAPKSKASLDTLKKWVKRCSDVKKHNDGIRKLENDKKKVRESVSKMKSK